MRRIGAPAVAVVCRDSRGNYLGSSAVVYPGLNDPASLEAIACNEVISLTLDLHLSKVVVVSDCLEVTSSRARATHVFKI